MYQHIASDHMLEKKALQNGSILTTGAVREVMPNRPWHAESLGR